MINKNINSETSHEIGQEIEKAFFEGLIPQWIEEKSYGFGFDFRGRIDSIILGGGNPTIYIDLFNEPGSIIVESPCEARGTFQLDNEILDEIIYFVEECENVK